MLKTFGAVHVLSNPSIRVKNTQPAVVSVGRNERYISQTTSNVSNSGGGQSTTSANVITGNLFDGVMLGVIPFISDDGTINLTINPVQTTIKPGSSDLINVGTDQNPQRISLPKVDFKGITTSLSMRSGDMVILGGLIDESGNRAKSGLPGLAEVPILGEAFGTVNRTVRSRELIVVLRVRTLGV
jgi:type II secretory pathway component GspD/PulD (secretin)